MTLLWTDGATDLQVCLISMHLVQNSRSCCMHTWQELITAQCKQASPLHQARVCGRGQHQRDACAGAPFPPARGNPSGFVGPAAGFNEPHHVHQPLEPGRGRGFAAGRGRSMLPKGPHLLSRATHCTWQLTPDISMDMHVPSAAGL